MLNQMAHVTLAFSAKLPYTVAKKGKWFVSSCPVLDVHSQGKTEKKAKENLVEALFLFLTSCLERNTLDEVLRECGFTANTLLTKKSAPRLSSKNVVDVPLYFDVPLNLLSNYNLSNTECLA
jgi:predicted RNase H-like HicB family nuclease